MYGEMPSGGKYLFTACDSEYFRMFGAAFCYSAVKNSFRSHIHVINPTNESFSHAALLTTLSAATTFSFEDVDLSNLTPEQQRTLYACRRFELAPMFLEHCEGMLILDIDCIINNKFHFPTEKLGLFLRKPLLGTTGWEKEGTRVAAGAVYYSKSAIQQAQIVATAIHTGPLVWFADQVALAKMASAYDGSIKRFDNTFLDWNFDDNSCIWTGKGERKYNDAKYTKKAFTYSFACSQRIKGIGTVILAPRLDLPFKKSGLVKSGPISPLRKHWQKFVDKIATKESALVIEAPRWMFNETLFDMYPAKKYYIPHSEKHLLTPKDESVDTRYYMQTVFPEIFTVDKKGWGGGAEYRSWYDPTVTYPENEKRKELEKRLRTNMSKFVQPNIGKVSLPEDYLFVPLQLPHDETIKHHSNVSVEDFVNGLCWFVDLFGGVGGVPEKIVFKGHPANIGSMAPLKARIQQSKNGIYVEDVSILPLIENSKAVVVINSGVGQEAMLLGKPVFAAGESEYSSAVGRIHLESLDLFGKQLLDLQEPKGQYDNWFNWWLSLDEVVDVVYNYL